MELVILLLLILTVILLAVVLLKLFVFRNDGQGEAMEQLQSDLRQMNQQAASDTQRAVVTAMGSIGQSLNSGVRTMGESLGTNIQNMRLAMSENQRLTAAAQTEKIESIDRHVMARQEAMNENVSQQMQVMEQRLANLEKMNEQKLEALRQSMQASMLEMRQENAKKLDEIRGTVDEKLQDTLQKKITESFQTVSQQLEQVYKGLGEMQALASDVGGLKQVLSGVKTRGILGEIQLGAILEEILSPEQYETNVATIPDSRERVEFAVKLPGSDGGHVYLPIDSKFPGDTFMHLQDAQATGDPAAMEEARKALVTVLKNAAFDGDVTEIPALPAFRQILESVAFSRA